MSSANGITAPLVECVLEPLLTQLLRLFPSRSDTRFRRLGSSTWRQMSRFHYLTDEEIAASIDKDSAYVRAAALDDMTRFLVMTIPAGSRYSDSEQFSRLLACLRASKLHPKSYRAADSEDIQVFLPFSEATDTASAARVLSSELLKENFEIAPHSLIIHSTSEPFTLPLQAKFAWLNDDLSVKVLRDDIGLDAAIALFLADLSRAAVSPAVLIDRPAPANQFLAASVDKASSQSEVVVEAINHPIVFEESDSDFRAPMVEEVSELETQQELGAQLQLFSVPAIQQPRYEPLPIRRSRRRRPRSDPQAPRAEPQTNKLFPVITTDNISTSNSRKEVAQKD